MRRFTYSAYLILLLSLLYATGYAQQTSYPSLPKVERQVRWLERQGFPARGYPWTQPEINRSLQQALVARGQANGRLIGGYSLVGAGGGITIVGGLGVMIIAVISPIAGQDVSSELTRYGIITGLGAGALVGGIILTVHGRKKKRVAQQHVLSAVRRHNRQL